MNCIDIDIAKDSGCSNINVTAALRSHCVIFHVIIITIGRQVVSQSFALGWDILSSSTGTCISKWVRVLLVTDPSDMNTFEIPIGWVPIQNAQSVTIIQAKSLNLRPLAVRISIIMLLIRFRSKKTYNISFIISATTPALGQITEARCFNNLDDLHSLDHILHATQCGFNVQMRTRRYSSRLTILI